MSLSAEEQRHLRAVLTLFFPEERGAIAEGEPNEQTLELTERFLIEVDKCTRVMQKFVTDLAGGMTRGFLRKVLRSLGQDAIRPDGYLRGNLPCSNTGRARYKQPIMISLSA